MIIVKNQIEIESAIDALKKENSEAVVGLVPTMGALHEGHMSLIQTARETSDIVVCSIFVNPTQFNNPTDLETYPRTIEEDKTLLEREGCDIVLIPGVDDVYPNGEQPYEIDLEGLDDGMEGAFRPGHFKGVCMVVERFFEMVKPDRAYFGKKDFQQMAIIRKMTAIRNIPTEIIGVPIKRSEQGLALSSRNMLLSEQGRQEATLIYRALSSGINLAKTVKDADTIQSHVAVFFEGTTLEVEYIAIVNNNSLQPVINIDNETSICIVVYCEGIRLIDNMQFDV